MEYRLDIQGLRAIAVLLVFLFHLDEKIVPGGYVGVDIFFVISGYLISGIIWQKIKKGNFSFISFYKSRIKRIVPAYIFLLFVISIIAIYLYLNTNIGSLRKGLFYTFLFNSNNYFATLDSYFGATGDENPLLHTWTLAVEMQFYLVLPVLLFFLKKLKINLVLFVIGFILIATLVYSQIQISLFNNSQAMYFSLTARSCEFLIGSLIAIRPISISSKKNENLLSIIALILLLTPAFIYNSETPFPGLTALVPCMGAGLLIVTNGSKINKILSKSFFVRIGEFSYSIYLWHWPIMAFYRYYNNSYYIGLKESLIIILLTLVISFLSYTYIENTFRKFGDIKVIVYLGPIVILLAISIYSMISINAKYSRIPADYASYQPMGLISHGKYYSRDEYIGDSKAKDTLLLIGDSHGLVLKPYLDYLGKRNQFTVQTITNDGYLPISGISEEEFKESWRYDVYRRLCKISSEAMEHVPTIIIAKSWYSDSESTIQSLKKLMDDLEPRQNLIFMSDFPIVDKNPIRINRHFLRDTSKKSDFERIEPRFPTSLRDVISTKSNVHYLDLTHSKIFENIPYFKDTIMYYDERHINKFGSIHYAKDTEEDFMRLYNSIRNDNIARNSY